MCVWPPPSLSPHTLSSYTHHFPRRLGGRRCWWRGRRLCGGRRGGMRVNEKRNAAADEAKQRARGQAATLARIAPPPPALDGGVHFPAQRRWGQGVVRVGGRPLRRATKRSTERRGGRIATKPADIHAHTHTSPPQPPNSTPWARPARAPRAAAWWSPPAAAARRRSPARAARRSWRPRPPSGAGRRPPSGSAD